MKFLCVSIFICFVLSQLNGQKKFSEYYSTSNNKSYDIRISQSKKESDKRDFTIWIDCESKEKYKPEVCLVLNGTQLPDFKEFLLNIKNTYKRWDSTAKANNVKELAKDFDIKKFKAESYFKGSETFFDFNTPIYAYAVIFEEKMRAVISNAKELKSSSNEYITHKGFRIIFSSVEEIEEFVSKLDEEKINKEFESKKDTDSLFK
jgi:hypothetical protein